MKLKVVRYKYEPPALAIEAETEYEAAVLSRYWSTAELTRGVGGEGVDGYSYGIRFREPKDPS